VNKLLVQRIRNHIEEVRDFPKPGISYKDITPVLRNPELCGEIIDEMERNARALEPDIIVGLESRGFMFGFALAQRLDIGFIPMRKPGKLPRDVYAESYDLEYGSAVLELHREDILPDSRVLIHDDLLATGGTAAAAASLITKVNAHLVGYDFLVELAFLRGRHYLPAGVPVHSMVRYN
jgi:adenine phosphoribosyltransferase